MRSGVLVGGGVGSGVLVGGGVGSGVLVGRIVAVGVWVGSSVGKGVAVGSGVAPGVAQHFPLPQSTQSPMISCRFRSTSSSFAQYGSPILSSHTDFLL